MKELLFKTHAGYDALALRLGLGIMIFPHGAQKVLGWFGGYGFSATMDHFTQSMGIPTVFASAAILAEFLGGIALIAGFLTRISAGLVGFTLLVGAFMSHVQHGFFMNWSGQQSGEGFEFHILSTVIAIALIIRGAGPFSLDHMIQSKT